jgi:hypothetical protein
MQRLGQTLRVLESAATALQTWQWIMRTTGPMSMFRMATHAISVVSGMLWPATGPMMFPGPSPERLDLRTRLGFLLNGLGTLGCLSYGLPLLVRPGAGYNRRWRRGLARKGLWTRLTATDRHGRAYTLAAAVLAMLSGIAAYRSHANESGPGLFPGATLEVLGQVGPHLPFFGISCGSAKAPTWIRLLAVPGAPIAVYFAITSLRTALMPEEDYEEARRRWNTEVQQRSQRHRDSTS